MSVNPRTVHHLEIDDVIQRGGVKASEIHQLGAHETLTAFARYQKYLEELLNGHQSMWMAAFRGSFGKEFWQTELMNGWKVMDIAMPLASTLDHETEKAFYFAAAKQMGLDPQAEHTIRNAGATRVHLIGEAIGNEDWDNHWMRERLASQGAGERIVGVCNLSPICESVMLVDRPPGAPSFSDADAAELLGALEEFRRLHYWMMLERGLVEPATKPLAPLELEVVKALLGPDSEAQIADALGLTQGVLHNYVSSIMRIFQVNSRHALVQLWIRNV